MSLFPVGLFSSPDPPVITSVELTGASQVTVHFSIPVTLSTSGTSNSFTVNGMDSDVQAQVAVDAISLVFNSYFPQVGDSWVLAYQPPWLLDTISTPDGGVVV